MLNSAILTENLKKVKYFVTLIASVYHPLLRKQEVLGSILCKKKENFWGVLHKAYKEMNDDNEKFFPTGWCTDMASENFIG